MASWISESADVASLLGLLITIWVLFQTFMLRRAFSRRVRIPQIRKKLTASVRALLEQLKEWPNSRNAILAEFAKTRALLANLTPKLDRAERIVASRLRGRLLGQRSMLFFRKPLVLENEDQVWSIHADIQEIVVALEQREKDGEWE
jgi:hypothetical protein